MNKEIIQICNITIALKFALKTNTKIEYFPFEYEKSIEFLFTKNKVFFFERSYKAKTIEELGELIVALQKDLLAGKDGLSKEVIEEMADVHVMLLQLMMYDEDYFNDVYDEMRYKLERQQERIRNEGVNSMRV